MDGIKMWRFFDGFNIYCPNRKIKDKILSVTGATERGIYYRPDGSRAYDILVPKRFEGRVMKMLQGEELPR